MSGLKARRGPRPGFFGWALLIGASVLLAPTPVAAHFILMAPDSWMSQDTLGLPEKLGPCGDEGGGTPTGAVTAFRSGQTVAVTIDEVIPHPGHYRVALAVNSRDELPAEPLVTPTADDPCAGAAIEDPVQFPILADNLLPHTQAFVAPETFLITLPAYVTCTKCTLQLLEFMSSHSAPCFYHHCADISIQGPLETPTPVPSTPTATPTQFAAATATPASTICVGDCDNSGSVTISAIITLMNIALGTADPSRCPDGIPDGVQIDVALIIRAVNNALNSCHG